MSDRIGVWDIESRGGLDAAWLQTAGRILPHSELAHGHALVALSQRKQRGSVTATGLNALREQYVTLLKLLGDRSIIDRGFLRIGYHVNHPGTLLDPRDSILPRVLQGYTTPEGETVVAYVPLLEFPRDLPQRTSCPRHTRGTSCFTDTPFVLMFLGTDAFDTALLAEADPAVLVPTEEESRLAETFDDIETVCSAPRGGDVPDAVVRMRHAARNIAWGMRLGGRSVDVEANISRFRDALQECMPQTQIARGQDDAAIIYEVLLIIGGWSRWFFAPLVSITTRNAINNKRLLVPDIIGVSVLSGRLAGRIKLTSVPDGHGTSMQELINATLGATRSTDEHIFPADWTSIENLLADASASMKRAIEEMYRKAIPIFVQRGVVHREALARVAAGRFPTLMPPAIDTQAHISAMDAVPRGNTRMLFDVAKQVYASTLGALLSATNQMKRADGTFNPLATRSPYQMALEQTGPLLREVGIATTLSERQYFVAPPEAGVIIISADVYRVESGRTAASTPTALPFDRVLHLPIGSPPETHTVPFRIFAVVVKDSGPEGGHFWGYFWRGSAFYRYNDTSEQVLVETSEFLEMSTIERRGMHYMAERVPATSTSTSPPQTPPPGTPRDM